VKRKKNVRSYVLPPPHRLPNIDTAQPTDLLIRRPLSLLYAKRMCRKADGNDNAPNHSRLTLKRHKPKQLSSAPRHRPSPGAPPYTPQRIVPAFQSNFVTSLCAGNSSISSLGSNPGPARHPKKFPICPTTMNVPDTLDVSASLLIPAVVASLNSHG